MRNGMELVEISRLDGEPEAYVQFELSSGDFAVEKVNTPSRAELMRERNRVFLLRYRTEQALDRLKARLCNAVSL